MNVLIFNLKNQRDVEGLMGLHIKMNMDLRVMMKNFKTDPASTKNREMLRSWIKAIEQALILFVPQAFEQSTFRTYGRR